MLRPQWKIKFLLYDRWPWTGLHFVLRQVTRLLYLKYTRNMSRYAWRSANWCITFLPHKLTLLNQLCHLHALMLNCLWHEWEVWWSVGVFPLVYNFSRWDKQILLSVNAKLHSFDCLEAMWILFLSGILVYVFLYMMVSVLL